MRGLIDAASTGWRAAALVAGITAVVVATLLGDALVGDCIFALRDSAHTFPALYGLVRDEWLAGSAPLWNPLLNAGQPLAGTGVAGAFYPPQILLTALLPDGLSLNALVAVHLVLAGIAAGLIARDAGCGLPSALLAGLTYACCGSVFFQVFNPIIAAGAAWFAWAVRAGLRLSERFSAADLLVLAVSLAFAVLAGDPQAAFHAGLVLGVLLAWRHRRSPMAAAAPAGRLAAAAVFAAALALVQITPSAEFLRDTTRFTDAWPMSVWEVPRFLREADAESLRTAPWYAVMIGRPPEAVSFYHDVYRFSVAPWRWLDLVSPTLAGPVLRRWPQALGFERDAWTATLYAGAIPLACMLAATWRRGDRRTAVWIVLLVFAMLASLGGSGLVGAARHVTGWIGGGGRSAPYVAGDEVGGVYWLMATLLPGYAGFRYPAKWLTPCALAFAQLAAIGFDTLVAGSSVVFVRRALVAMGMTAVACTAGAVALAPATDARFIAAGGALAVASCTASLLVLRRPASVVTAWSLVAIAAADLVAAGRLHTAVSSFSALLEGGRVLEAMAGVRLPACRAAGGRPRLAVVDGLMADPETDDIEAWSRGVGTIMRGNTPLLHGWGKFGEPGTALEADVELLCSPLDPVRVAGFARRVFDAATVEFFVLPGDSAGRDVLPEFQRDWSARQRGGELHGPFPEGPVMPTAAEGPAPAGGAAPIARFIRNESALPRVRITRSVRWVEPLAKRPRGRWVAGLATLAFPGRDLPWLGDTAVVEVAGGRPAFDVTVPAEAAAESCRIVIDEPRRVVVEATLAAPGLVVLADTFHPDWRLRVTTDAEPPRDVEPLRVNRIHRGCAVTQGRHLLEFSHRSYSFERSAFVSLVAWIGAIAWALALVVRKGGL
jgi:hypothetical protein